MIGVAIKCAALVSSHECRLGCLRRALADLDSSHFPHTEKVRLSEAMPGGLAGHGDNSLCRCCNLLLPYSSRKRFRAG